MNKPDIIDLLLEFYDDYYDTTHGNEGISIQGIRAMQDSVLEDYAEKFESLFVKEEK